MEQRLTVCTLKLLNGQNLLCDLSLRVKKKYQNISIPLHWYVFIYMAILGLFLHYACVFITSEKKPTYQAVFIGYRRPLYGHRLRQKLEKQKCFGYSAHSAWYLLWINLKLKELMPLKVSLN